MILGDVVENNAALLPDKDGIVDEIERFAPRNPSKHALSLWTFAHRWVEQAIFTVQPLAEAPHLGADEAVSDRIPVRAVDGENLPVLDGHRQTACVGTIEGARRFHR